MGTSYDEDDTLMRYLPWLFPPRPTYPEPRTLVRHPDVIAGQAGIHPQRFLTLDGGINFRDLGGYPTRDGRQVRWGRIYRSGSFARLTPADLATIARLDIKLICDLRSPEEIRRAPEALPNIAQEEMPLEADDGVLVRVRALLFSRRKLGALLTRAYIEVMLRRNGQIFHRIFERVADEDNLPLLIRCTAGKDRTGLSAALLLLALGVEEETVIADYSLSNLYFEDFRAFAAAAIKPLGIIGLSVEDMQPLLLADPNTLEATLAHLRGEYGSVESYLRDVAGVDSTLLERVRANLLA
jgi:protein-tyrosine phosphatase